MADLFDEFGVDATGGDLFDEFGVDVAEIESTPTPAEPRLGLRPMAEQWFHEEGVTPAEAALAGAATGTLGLSEAIFRAPGAAERWARGLAESVEAAPRTTTETPRQGLRPMADEWFQGGSVPRAINPLRAVESTAAYLARGQIPGTSIRTGGGSDVAERIDESQKILAENFAPFRENALAAKRADDALKQAVAGDYSGIADVVTDPKAMAGFIGQAAPSLAASYLSGGSIPFIAWMESMEVAKNADEFEQRTGQKIADRDFMQAQAQAGLINSMLEKVVPDALLKGEAGKSALNIALTGGKEFATEGLQAFNTNLAEMLSFNAEKDLAEGVLPGALGGLGAGTGAGAAQYAVGRSMDEQAPDKTGGEMTADELSAELDSPVTLGDLGEPGAAPGAIEYAPADVRAEAEPGYQYEGAIPFQRVEPELTTELGAAPEPADLDPGIPYAQAPDLGIETERDATRRVSRDQRIRELQDELGDVTLPENFEDPRLKRLGYRDALQDMAKRLIPGGGISLVPREGAVRRANTGDVMYDFGADQMVRTKSQNPQWFQALSEGDSAMSVEGVRKAVEKALTGETLGVRQQRVIGSMLAEYAGERGEQVDYAREQLELARNSRRSRGAPGADTAGEWYAEEAYHDEDTAEARILREVLKEANAIDREQAEAIVERLAIQGASDFEIAEALEEAILTGENYAEYQKAQQGGAAYPQGGAGEGRQGDRGPEAGRDRRAVRGEEVQAAGAPAQEVAAPAFQVNENRYGGLNVQGDPQAIRSALQAAGVAVKGVKSSSGLMFGKANAAEVRQALTRPVSPDRRRAAVPVTEDRRQGDRRQDTAERRRVGELTEDEAKRELLTSEKAGIPNERAYNESDRKQSQAFFDLDNFKQINEKYSYRGADQLLAVVGRVMREEAGDVLPYHFHGDEFVAEHDDKTVLADFAKRVQDRLGTTETVVIHEDGTVLTKEGVLTSYGIGKDKAAAESDLKRSKAERARAGLRTERGRDDGGVAAEAAEGGARGVQVAAEEVTGKEPRQPLADAGVSASDVEKFAEFHDRANGSVFVKGDPSALAGYVEPFAGKVVKHKDGIILTKAKARNRQYIPVTRETLQSGAIVDTFEDGGAMLTTGGYMSGIARDRADLERIYAAEVGPDKFRDVFGEDADPEAAREYADEQERIAERKAENERKAAEKFQQEQANEEAAQRKKREQDEKAERLEAERQNQWAETIGAGKAENPLYQAFLDTVEEPEKLRTNAEYIGWIGERNAEFEKENGPRPFMSNSPEAKEWSARQSAYVREYADANLSERVKTQRTKPDEESATAILDRANVTGKDRLDIMRDFRDGKYSLKDLEEAYPAKEADRGGRDAISRGAEANIEGSAETDRGEQEQKTQGYAVDEAAREAATHPDNDLPEPTDAQKEAGNYRKGHVTLHGLDISIENPRGSERSGIDPGGQRWSVTMAHHYGYIKGTVGRDKDHLDVFLGPDAENADLPVFVIDQVSPDTGRFDEHKILMGFADEQAARSGYLANYSKGWEGLGGITQMSMDEFKTWLRDGDTTKRITARNEAAADRVARAAPMPIKKGAAEKIEDFGEKIEGARKDTWQSYAKKMGDAAGVDIAAEPLAKSWPEPDYQKMIDEGADPWVVAFIRSARDEVPPKPRVRWKVKGWAKQVETLRGFANDLIANPEMADEVRKRLDDNPTLDTLAGRIELYQIAGHGISLKGVTFQKHHYALYQGERNVDLWTVQKDAKATSFSNWPTEFAVGKTKQEALDNFKKTLAAGAFEKKESSRQIRFDIYAYRSGGKAGKWFIGKKVGNEHVDLESFGSAKEAREYLADNQEKLEAKLAKFKEIPAHRKESNSPRVGADHRSGADVTPEQFQEAFGFRGVQFGNYVEQAKRQEDLNEAYDALMDLAGILNIPAQALSLNGELGLAFGARGKGAAGRSKGQGVAKAHYESGQIVINLTKNNGAGSLAHEWWHSLDNYFSRARSDKEGFVSEKPYFRGEGVRQEVVDAFKQVTQAINKSRMQQRSAKLDKTRTKDYWTTGREMSARAFESYTIEKLKDQGAANDYLANIVSEEYWNVAAALGIEKEGSYPYPEAAELPAIRAAFDNFFRVVETKHTDKGVALFARSPSLKSGPTEDLIYRGKQPAQGQSADTIREAIAPVILTWGDNAPAVEVADNQSGLPEHIRRQIGAGGTVQGVHDSSSGTVYLVADALSNKKDALRILAHEAVGHFGLEEFMGDMYQKVVDRVKWLKRAGNKKILAIADRVASAYPGIDANTEAREILAHLAEERQFGGVLKDMASRIYAAARQFLRRLGFKVLWSTPEIDAMLARAARYLRESGGRRRTIPEALEHPQLGEIDVALGKGRMGASKFVAEHPEIGANLEDLIAGAKLTDETATRATLENGGATFDLIKRAGRWVLTDARADFARSDDTQGAYESRIDELFAGEKPSPHGVRVLDRSDVLNLLGYGDLPIHAAEGKVSAGQYNHGLTAEHWKKIPEWLENPVAVFDSDTVAGRLVFVAPDAVRGAPVVMIVEPETTMGRVNVHLLVNAYEKTGRLPVQRWVEDGLLRYLDEKQSPVVSTTTGLRLPRVVHQQRGSKKRILTQRDLVKRRAEPTVSGMDFARDTLTPMAQREGSGDNLTDSNPLKPESEEFREWFGDSEIVDGNGNPLRLYHGMSGELRGGKFRTENRDAYLGPGIYMTDDVETAERYAEQIDGSWGDRENQTIVPLYANIANPFVVSDGGTTVPTARFLEVVRATLSAPDYEGVIGYLEDQGFSGRKNLDARTIAAALGGGDYGNPWFAGNQEETPKVLIALGYDGAIIDPFHAFGSSRMDEGRHIVAFSNDQVRFAIGATSESPNQPQRTQGAGVDFARAATAAQQGASTQAALDEIPTETAFQRQQRLHQDKFNRFRVIEEWLQDRGASLTEASSVYRAEERYHGRVATRTEDFREQTLKPLIKKIQKAGFTLDQVAEFLHAQHAEERNEQIAKINPAMPDGGSGMTNAEADAILAKAPKELADLANEYRAITDRTREMLLKAGIITQEMADAWQATYEHYVPLKGGDEAVAGGTGKGFTAKNKQKRAMGHRARDEMILENIQRDHERAIMLVEKNRVGQHLLRLAVDAGVPDLITIDKPKKRAVLRDIKTYDVTYHGSTVGSFDSLEAARVFVSAESGKPGRNAADFAINTSNDPTVAYMASPMLQPNETQVYVDGHAVRVQFNDELLAQAYNNLGTEHMNAIFRAGRQLNAYLSRMYTGYSIDFIFTNAARDWTSGLINLTGAEGIGFAARAAKNYTKAASLLAKYGATGKASPLVAQYRADGGTTGAAYLSDLERLGHEAKATFDQYAGLVENVRAGKPVRGLALAGEKAVTSILKPIERLNMVFENAMRLSAYMTALESGMSREHAASLAKNATVNFNRKGEIGQHMNALWLFHNASIQGSAIILKSLFKAKHKHQAQALVGGLVGIGALMAATMGGADDDDYEKLPEYVKERNLTFRTSDGWVTIPIPYGYGWFVTLGRKLHEIQTGKIDPAKAAIQVAANLAEETTVFGAAFSGDEPESKDLMFLLPTAIQIPAAPIMNRTSLHAPLYPESFNPEKPDSQLMYRNTVGSLWDKTATWMNEATGGDAARRGWVDVSPETLKYIWNTATGGTGRGVTDTINAVSLAIQGADPELRELPIVRRFVQESQVSGARARFWKHAKEARAAKNRFDLARKAKSAALVDDVMTQEKHMLQLADMASSFTGAVSAKRDEIDRIRTDESIPLAQRRLQIKALEKEEEKLYDQYVERHKRAVEKASED